MKREKMVLGLGPGSKRIDGSQDEVVMWSDRKDAIETTSFFRELSTPGWDVPTVYARLKTGEYVIGDGHSSMCGTIVTENEFAASVNRRIAILEADKEMYKSLLKKE